MARKGNPISVRLDFNRSSDSSWFLGEEKKRLVEELLFLCILFFGTRKPFRFHKNWVIEMSLRYLLVLLSFKLSGILLMEMGDWLQLGIGDSGSSGQGPSSSGTGSGPGREPPKELDFFPQDPGMNDQEKTPRDHQPEGSQR